MYYSAKNNAFYDDRLQEDYKSSKTWPDDALHIDDNEWQRLLIGQENGMRIMPGNNGIPELLKQLRPTKEELIMQAQDKKSRLLEKATSRIAPLQDAVDLEVATDEENNLLKEWKSYRILLNRVDTNKVPASPWPTPPQ